MADRFDHVVLIVDDEEQIGRAVGRIMRQIGVAYVYVDSGQAALERIQSVSSPFSLIISDQRMPGMQGAEFLEKAKEISPETIRFLLTGYADADALTQAVNKGSIHRYIAKPWNNKELIEAVKTGFEQYELAMENDRMFKMAKEQNTKLYSLNNELKKIIAAHQKAMQQKDKEILEMEEQLESGFENRNYLNELEALLRDHDLLEQEKVNSLYAETTAKLFEQFKDIANRNGFEMPSHIAGE